MADNPKTKPAAPATPQARRLKLETEWLHAYARTYLPIETPFSFPAERLRRAGVTLVDIRNVFRSGAVVKNEKLDGPGAYWGVEGEDLNGRHIQLGIVVVSEEVSVSLENVEVVNVKEDGDGNDAA